jgi:hypothetical protein
MHQQLATLGADFARALAAKDSTRLISVLFGRWFEDSDEIEALEHLESDSFADRQRVGYRFSVSNPDGRFVVEQQAYLAARDGQIGWMRVLCSGFRQVT